MSDFYLEQYSRIVDQKEFEEVRSSIVNQFVPRQTKITDYPYLRVKFKRFKLYISSLSTPITLLKVS